jgi:hypothetical protein
VGNPSAAVNLTVDNIRPLITLNAPSGTVKPAKNAGGRWQVTLNGTVTEAGSGIKAGSLLVQLQQQAGAGVAQTYQVATQTGNNWSLTYLLDAGLFDPTGAYTVTVTAADNVGNIATPVSGLLRLDTRGPTANLNALDANRSVITQTLTIGGVISDTESIAGIDKLEIAFTPVEQVAALPAGLTSEQAEAQLNRTWTPVTLAGRGAGVATTTWSFAIPAGLENIYQIDLRGTDMLGNVSISSGLWRGMIDTSDPRVVMTASATGLTHLNAQGQRRFQIRFVCGAQDRNLNEASFACPGRSLAEPIRSFADNAALQTLFPDLTLRTGLALSYTLWSETASVVATASACDSFGRCATANTSITAADNPASGPTAVIVAPAAERVLAVEDGTLQVTIAAEAAGLLKEVVLLLDNVNVGVITLSQAEAQTRVQRTIAVPAPTQGQHTLSARASDWAGATQTTLYPVQITLDSQPPVVTLDTVVVSEAETWALGSGILRFSGNVNDAIGLAAVQVKVGSGPFVDATFGDGEWRIAYPVPDPEGQNLTVLVRAIDRAGRLSEVSQIVPVNLSTANPPDTTLTVTPPNPSSGPSAGFAFGAVAGGRSVAAFECQLDSGRYEPCASPFTLNDLSKGAHTFRVRAIDAAGYVDPTPATYSWTVSPGALDVTITGAPADPTTSRSASFVFSGNGVSMYECSLDGAVFTPCASGQSYSDLANGSHTFLVRGRNGATVGVAARHSWTVNNAAPVATDQSVTTNQDMALAITLTASDEDALTYIIVNPPAHGSLIGAPPNLTYSPDSGFAGADSFTFRANDGLVNSNLATVNISVQSSTPPTPTPVTPTATATNPPTPTSTSTPVSTNTPVPPTATPTPAGTLVGSCGGYTVYKVGNNYTADGWSGAILVGTSGANTLNGGSGRDLVLGLGGNDKIDGKGGDDVLCGGDGVDLLTGAAGNDFLDGGAGADVLNGGAGDYDVLIGGEGNDVLLDGDGVLSAQGGPGDDAFTIALRNGWRNPQGQSRFDGLTAGYGNDAVGLAILNLTRFFVDISGDERDNPPSPLEGANDALVLAGVIDPASNIIKFERRTVVSAALEDERPLSFEGFLVAPTTLTDESGAEFLTEAVGDDAGDSGALSVQLYLPLITAEGDAAHAADQPTPISQPTPEPPVAPAIGEEQNLPPENPDSERAATDSTRVNRTYLPLIRQ